MRIVLNLRLLSLSLCLISFVIGYGAVISDGPYTFVTINGTDNQLKLYQANGLEGEVVLPSKVKFGNKDYLVTGLGVSALANQPITKLTIPASYKELHNSAFYECKSLIELHISNSESELTVSGNENKMGSTFCDSPLKKVFIGRPLDVVTRQGMFANCPIEMVVFTNKFKSLPQRLYLGNTKLKTVQFYDSVSEIPSATFAGSTSLESIELPKGVLQIDSYAFQNCSSLNDIKCTQNVKYIGEYAFSKCEKLENVDLSSVEKIDDRAFNGCQSLKEVKIPMCRNIGKCAFFGCKSLACFVYPEGFEKISDGALLDCDNIMYLEFPSTLKSIGDGNNVFGSFSSCAKLIQVICKASTPPLVEDDGAFTERQMKNAKLLVPMGSIDLYKSDEYWKKFDIIEASGVDYINEEKSYLTVNQIKMCVNGRHDWVSVYSLNGNMIGRYKIGSSITLGSGIYLLKSGEQSRKIIVKKH